MLKEVKRSKAGEKCVQRIDDFEVSMSSRPVLLTTSQFTTPHVTARVREAWIFLLLV